MRSITAAAFIFLQFVASTAHARLGENESTIESDRHAMRGARIMRAHELFRVHEITAAGSKVREYVTNDGTVFAVTWSGVSHPDLSQLFGRYYSEFQEADQAMKNPKGRAPKHVRTQNLMTLRFGHMRDVHGKAYVPSLAPPGFDPRDLQ